MKKKKIMFIASGGGHLTEVLKVSSLFANYDYVLVTEKNKISLALAEKYNMEYLLSGSRYYPFSYILVCIINFFKNIYLFLKYYPDLVYTTGAHTAVMMCYLAKLFRKKVIFIEVFDRITKPTLSGRIIYPIADTFIVQHRELLSRYRKAKYLRGIYL